jgi:hypothetical protein
MVYDPNNRRGKRIGYLTVYQNGEVHVDENSTGQDREAFEIIVWREIGNPHPVVNCQSARGVIPLWWNIGHNHADLMQQKIREYLGQIQRMHTRSKNIIMASY